MKRMLIFGCAMAILAGCMSVVAYTPNPAAVQGNPAEHLKDTILRYAKPAPSEIRVGDGFIDASSGKVTERLAFEDIDTITISKSSVTKYVIKVFDSRGNEVTWVVTPNLDHAKAIVDALAAVKPSP